MNTTVFIYALIDPESMDARYIGKSVRPKERLTNHMSDKSRCHRTHWLQSLKARGLKPRLVILQRLVDGSLWQEAERSWIAFGRRDGWPLTNNTDGGDGVCGLPAETRARIAAVWKGRKHKPETLEKLRKARARRICSIKTRARMSASLQGRMITWGDKLAKAVRKLSENQVAEIKLRLDAGERVKDLAEEFGVHRTTLSKINTGMYCVRGQKTKREAES